FWYQPRHNVMVSSEWAAPNTFSPGPNFDDVKTGKYGRKVHVWDWKERKIIQSIDLAYAAVPLEVRFAHDPEKSFAFVGGALSGEMCRLDGPNPNKQFPGSWTGDVMFTVDPVKKEGFPGGAVPALLSDLLLSMDDRFLYLCLWLHGEVRQYDISDP